MLFSMQVIQPPSPFRGHRLPHRNVLSSFYFSLFLRMKVCWYVTVSYTCLATTAFTVLELFTFSAQFTSDKN